MYLPLPSSIQYRRGFILLVTKEVPVHFVSKRVPLYPILDTLLGPFLRNLCMNFILLSYFPVLPLSLDFFLILP